MSIFSLVMPYEGTKIACVLNFKNEEYVMNKDTDNGH